MNPRGAFLFSSPILTLVFASVLCSAFVQVSLKNGMIDPLLVADVESGYRKALAVSCAYRSH